MIQTQLRHFRKVRNLNQENLTIGIKISLLCPGILPRENWSTQHKFHWKQI